MLVRILGAALLAVGVVLALDMLLGVLWSILSVAFVAVLLWGGWRLLKS